MQSVIEPQPAVRCRGIIKEFGQGEARTRVLKGINLDVNIGQMTFLIGPSGCGKTTLISIIAGLLTPEAGTVELFGQSLNKLRGGRLVDYRGKAIGFIFQQFNLLPALTAAENAAVPLLAQGVPARKAIPMANALLERLGMGAQTKKFPSQLSGGQQQRVAICRALVHQPKLIICDEPTASLDAETGRTVMELLRDVAVDKDRAVIVVTHDNRIYSFADRIVAMSDGLMTTPEASEKTPAIVPLEVES
jgi:putative ABC transport system ATP-binding protein